MHGAGGIRERCCNGILLIINKPTGSGKSPGERKIKMMVVRCNYENDTCEVLFENESYTECELFVNNLKDKTNIEIVDRY